jgi:hypothetical protein
VIAFGEFKVGTEIGTGGKNIGTNTCLTTGSFHNNHPAARRAKIDIDPL